MEKLQGNEAYVEAVRKFAPKVKVSENPIPGAQDTIMHAAAKFDFSADCETYMEKKMKEAAEKKKTVQNSKEPAVKVDPLSELEKKAEVVKGEK